jgi:hypothetical protein
MQFVRNGPEVPGRLVFFCGAGVASAAGLPSSKGLALQLFALGGVNPNDVLHAAIKAERYDTTTELSNGVEAIRQASPEVAADMRFVRLAGQVGL